jgi:hypothetical protein
MRGEERRLGLGLAAAAKSAGCRSVVAISAGTRPCAQTSNAGSWLVQPSRTSRPWILQPQADPEHRLHPHQRQADEADRARERAADAAVGDDHHCGRHAEPSVQAKALGLGGDPVGRVAARQRMRDHPIGL